MSTFAIQRGPTPICTWDTESGRSETHQDVPRCGDSIALSETERVGFVLSPDEPGFDYRILIGDMSIEDLLDSPELAGGKSMAGKRFWPDEPYFESGRGKTAVSLQRRPEGSDDDWTQAFASEVAVVPSKIGEAAYQQMSDELQDLSRSLLIDLYGKSRHSFDLRFADERRSFRSREEELEAVADVLETLEPLLNMIAARPASRVKTQRSWLRYWGSERVSAAETSRLARRGLVSAARPCTVDALKRVDSFDLPEHQLLKAFLCELSSRLRLCVTSARKHLQAIEDERKHRDVQVNGGPTLYDIEDRPRIERLRAAERRAHDQLERASSLARSHFLRDVRPSLEIHRGDAFQGSGAYRAALRTVRLFLLRHTSWFEGEHRSLVAKLTSRLFEQWCFLRVVDGLRAAGLELAEWDESLRESLRSRFLIDFDRGLKFEGQLSPVLRLRVRYEPWVRGEESAARAGETICRIDATDVAWCPDIVIECLKRTASGWEPVYGIVLDSKYTSRVRSQHWNATRKYLQIRSVASRRQVMKQLWLISPGQSESIASEDPGVEFVAEGATCPRDEAVQFVLQVDPSVAPSHSVFRRFADGTVRFLRREFG